MGLDYLSPMSWKDCSGILESSLDSGLRVRVRVRVRVMVRRWWAPHLGHHARDLPRDKLASLAPSHRC